MSGAIENKLASGDHEPHFKEVSFCFNGNRLFKGGDPIAIYFAIFKAGARNTADTDLLKSKNYSRQNITHFNFENYFCALQL